MAVGFSTTNVLNPWLNSKRGGGSNITAPANTYVQIHVGDPGANGTTNPAAGSSTRAALTQTAASAGAIAITGTNPSWTNGGTTETVSHISVWDASSAGNFLYSIALTVAKSWAVGDTLTLTSCSVSVTPAAA